MTLTLLLAVLLKKDKSTFNLIVVKIASVSALIFSAFFYMNISKMYSRQT